MDIDRYKRPVGIVSLNNRNINLEIIKEGYAWAYREYLRGPYASEFIDGRRRGPGKKARSMEPVKPPTAVGIQETLKKTNPFDTVVVERSVLEGWPPDCFAR